MDQLTNQINRVETALQSGGPQGRYLQKHNNTRGTHSKHRSISESEAALE